MRSDLVVLLPPALDQYLRFQQRCEELLVNQFIPQFPVEGLPGSMNRVFTPNLLN